MTSTVSSNRRRGARFAAIACVAVAAAALGPSRGLAEGVAATRNGVAAARAADVQGSNPFAGRFPNLVLKTHDGRNVRFYDDLLKGKIVLINFMYATCKER